ncbi:hypothetical protein RFI_35433, partial [Reticulomyxa filosa]
MVSLEELAADQAQSPNKWNLSEKWKDFQDVTLRNLTSGSSSQGSSSSQNYGWGGHGSVASDFHNHVEEYDNSEPNDVSKEWFNSVIFKPTHDLLFHVLVTDHAIRIHAMRRSLLSLFTQVSLHNIVVPKEFEQILHICLSLRPHPAAELDPVNSMKPTDITGRLVRCLRDEQTKPDREKYYLHTLMSCSQTILRNLCINQQLFRKNTKKRGDNNVVVDQDGSSVNRNPVPVHGRSSRNYGYGYGGYNPGYVDEEVHVKALTYEWPGAEKMKLIVSSDPSLTNMGTTFVSVYQDQNKKKLLAKFTVNPFDFTKHVQVIEGSKFYYT